jgi:hypothetical protein
LGVLGIAAALTLSGCESPDDPDYRASYQPRAYVGDNNFTPEGEFQRPGPGERVPVLGENRQTGVGDVWE